MSARTPVRRAVLRARTAACVGLVYSAVLHDSVHAARQRACCTRACRSHLGDVHAHLAMDAGTDEAHQGAQVDRRPGRVGREAVAAAVVAVDALHDGDDRLPESGSRLEPEGPHPRSAAVAFCITPIQRCISSCDSAWLETMDGRVSV